MVLPVCMGSLGVFHFTTLRPFVIYLVVIRVPIYVRVWRFPCFMFAYSKFACELIFILFCVPLTCACLFHFILLLLVLLFCCFACFHLIPCISPSKYESTQNVSNMTFVWLLQRTHMSMNIFASCGFDAMKWSEEKRKIIHCVFEWLAVAVFFFRCFFFLASPRSFHCFRTELFI